MRLDRGCGWDAARRCWRHGGERAWVADSCAAAGANVWNPQHECWCQQRCCSSATQRLLNGHSRKQQITPQRSSWRDLPDVPALRLLTGQPLLLCSSAQLAQPTVWQQCSTQPGCRCSAISRESCSCSASHIGLRSAEVRPPLSRPPAAPLLPLALRACLPADLLLAAACCAACRRCRWRRRPRPELQPVRG